MGSRAAIAMVLVGPAVLGAAVPSPTPHPSPPPVGYEHVEVRLAQLDVVVRDKSGKFVSGLGPQDFTVQEDGVPLEIVAVDEWGRDALEPVTRSSPPPAAASPAPAAAPASPAPEAAAAEGERRSFVIVFDALGSSTALRMNQAKRAAQGFVRTRLRDGDLAAVYQLDLSLRPVSGITSNRAEIEKSIDKVAWMPASSLQDGIAGSILGDQGSGTDPLMKQRLTEQAANVSSELDWTREHIYESLENLTGIFQGMPGRRILVLVSPGFPMTTTGDVKQQSGGFTIKFESLIRALSKYGVTAYTLDIGDDLAAGDVSEPIDWRIAVGKLGMDENILSDLGLERSLGSQTASSRRQFLGVLAAETGGRMLTSTDLTRAFDTIQEESTHFYRIACRVSVGRGAARYRKTVVATRREGLTVTTRRGRYSDVVPADRTPQAAAAVDSLESYRPVAVRGVAFPLPAADPKKIPVEVVMEAVGPLDLPTSADGTGALDIDFRVVARAAGEIVDRYERSFTAKVKPEGVAALRRGFRLEGRLGLPPGIYEVQGTIRLANPKQVATWTATAAVPPQSKKATPVVAGILLAPEPDAASPILSRPTVPEDVDPLTLKPGMRVAPSTTPDVDPGAALLVVFWLRGVPEAEGKPKVDLSVKVLDAQSRALDLGTELLLFRPEPTGGYRGLAPYALRLEAGAAGGTSPARQTVPFTIVARDDGAPGAAAPGSATSSSGPGREP